MIGSQSLVLATAMAVSTTLIFLAFARQKPDSDDSLKHPLRSCLSAPGAKRRRKNKRVTFADNVKESRPKKDSIDGSCKRDVMVSNGNGMPANRVALYNGMIRDRSMRMECSSH